MRYVTHSEIFLIYHINNYDVRIFHTSIFYEYPILLCWFFFSHKLWHRFYEKRHNIIVSPFTKQHGKWTGIRRIRVAGFFQWERIQGYKWIHGTWPKKVRYTLLFYLFSQCICALSQIILITFIRWCVLIHTYMYW